MESTHHVCNNHLALLSVVNDHQHFPQLLLHVAKSVVYSSFEISQTQ